jgi:PPK2 family polyphosphate:nucleotide phosphotransferase
VNYRRYFRVGRGNRVSLATIDPGFTGKHESKEAAAAPIAANVEKLRGLQYRLYAEDERSLLICLQGLDAAGKDGTIDHILGAMNPQGTRVEPFKVPTREEAAHDFLWRVHAQVPARGEVVIFNRSHYEDVLVVRVHGLVPQAVWSERYDRINEFEQNLVDARTHILKFYLHISEREQLRRFKERLDDPARHWKISESDYTERALWPRYVEAYEEAIARTSTRHAPWFVIPADHKWFRNLAISSIVVDTLESMKMKLPKPTVDIDAIRRKYHRAKKNEG